MAQYHLHAAKPISRKNGQMVVRSAAYRAGQKLEDNRYGLAHDFSRKRGVAHTEMLVPANAPAWMRDREKFWNAVEQSEKRKDSQLAIPYDIALPFELSAAQHIALMREFIATEFTDRGLVADLAIHEPNKGKGQLNFHAHIMIPTRPALENGFGPKPSSATSRKEWERDRTENILRLRKSWAEHHNRHLVAAGFPDILIDHRVAAELTDDPRHPRHGKRKTKAKGKNAALNPSRFGR